MRCSSTRRHFTSTALAAAAGISAMTATGCGMGLFGLGKNNPPAIQLYTLRELTKNDFPGTLAKVAALGYGAVEFAGYGGLDEGAMKRLLADLGLRAAGTHVGFEALEKDVDGIISYNAAIGNRFIVCPSMPGVWREKGADGFREFGARLNPIAEKIVAAGLKFCYHNHSFEFKKDGGRYLIDYLFEEADAKLVGAEVDFYWVKHGGVDPAAFITKHRGRCPLIHMKDMSRGANPTFAPVGTGILDMEGIVAAARKGGAEWFIVEQDSSTRPILDEVGISARNLKHLLDG